MILYKHLRIHAASPRLDNGSVSQYIKTFSSNYDSIAGDRI